MSRALRHPIRLLRTRARLARQRVQHRREVALGAQLQARGDRTPVFVLGAPRSGTTLLYQLLTEGLDVGWLANAHLREPGNVSAIERSERPRSQRTPTDWASDYGSTAQPWGPHEAGEFFYRFAPRTPLQLDDAAATPERVAELRAAVRLFADACAAPVVFKNTINSLRVPLLARALPEARFVVIDRDTETNARSLLAGRAKRGQLHAWWSAVPAGSEAHDDDTPGEQVVWQISRLKQVVHAELERLAPDRTCTLTYEELATDPRGVLDRVHAWLTETGAQVARRPDVVVPDHFTLRDGGPLAAELEQQLQDALRATGVTT